MGDIANIPPSTSGVPSPQTTYTLTGLGLAGLTGDSAGSRFWDFDGVRGPPEGLLQSLSGGAAANASPSGSKGGVLRMDTTAAAGGNSQLFNNQRLAGDMATDGWYMASRQAFPITAAAANSKTGVGAADIALARSISMGVYGALSSTHFVVQFGTLWTGGFLDLGVNIDTAKHIFECWHPAGSGSIFARIDGGATVSAAIATVPVEMSIFINCYNNGTANQFQLDIDWVLYVFPR